MSPREAFKVGFLAFCADGGLGGRASALLMQKAAELLQKRALGLNDAVQAAGSVATPLRHLATAAGVGVPLMAGAGLGYLAHRAAVPEVDDEDVKRQELIEELRHYARQARDRQRARTLRAAGV